jgi:AsmA protein
VTISITDVKQRLQTAWAQRNGLRTNLQLWELRLRTFWASRLTWSMPKLPTKAGGLAIIGGVAIGALIALVMVIGIPVPFLAKPIAKRFEADTGYRLVISGSIKLRLLPSVIATVGKVSVVDGHDPLVPTRFTAEDMRIRMALWSLVSGRARLSEVVIGRPTLQLPLVRERPVKAASTASPAHTLPQNLAVDRLVVEDGAIEFISPPNRVETRIDGIALNGSLSDQALAVKAGGLIGEQVFLVEVKGKLPAGRDTGQASPFEIAIDAPGLLQGSVRAKAHVKSSGSVVAINSLAGTIGQSKFGGLASVDFAGKPAVKMDLDFQRLDLAVTSEADPDSGAPGGLDQPWSDKAVNLDGLNFVDAEMQITAADLRIDRFRFAPISVGTILSNGVLTAGIVRTGVYGGQAQGTLTIDASGAQPSHALRIDLTDVRALPLLSGVADFNALDGRMQAKIDVRGRGANPRAIMSTLEGAVDLLVQDGEIRSINVAKLIRSLAVSTLTGWQENRAEKTDLSQLSTFFRIGGGQATTDNLRLLGPLVRMTGAGTADVGAKTLQFKVDPKLVLSLEGQGGAIDPIGIGVPVVVQGTWAAPRIYPDMAGILDNPEAAYAKLRELGTGLFGTGTGLPGSPGNPLNQTIESLTDRLGGDRKGSKATTEVEKPPQPRPQPSTQAQPQAQPRPPAPSTSQAPSPSPGGPIGFFRDFFFR